MPTATSDLAPAPSAGQGATRPAPSTADVGGPDGGSDSSSNDPFENVAARLHRTARSDCPYLDTINRCGFTLVPCPSLPFYPVFFDFDACSRLHL